MTIGFYVLNASVISVYVGELFSTKYRFRGAGISQGAGKAVNVVMPFAVTWILANLQPTSSTSASWPSRWWRPPSRWRSAPRRSRAVWVSESASGHRSMLFLFDS